MKKLIVLMVLPLVVFTLIGASNSSAQEKKPEAKTEKHIKIITIKDGVKEEIDTVIVGGDVKHISSGSDDKFMWFASDVDAVHDSLTGKKEYRFGDGKGKKIVVMKHGQGREPIIIHESEILGDSGKRVMVRVETPGPENEDVLYFNEGRRGQRRMVTAPPAPGFQRLPAAPALLHFQNRGNVINLSDPGIISYKKKKMSGGREKITVIRNEVKENEGRTFNEFIDMEGGELKKMNEPKAVREFEIQKRDLGHPVDRKVEIKTTPEPEKK